MIVESKYWMTSYGKPSAIYGNTSLEIPESIGSAGELTRDGLKIGQPPLLDRSRISNSDSSMGGAKAKFPQVTMAGTKVGA